jgi:hypothetical protein
LEKIHTHHRLQFGSQDDGYIDEYMGITEDLFAGRYPDYLAIDTAYHDITHTLQATLCRIGAIIQVLTGQIKPPHSVPDTCSKLATCALFLLSAAASFVFFLPIGAMLLVIGLRQGVPASVDSYEEMSVDDPGSERAR